MIKNGLRIFAATLFCIATIGTTNALASSTAVKIDATTFPDANFRAIVLDEYSDGKGYVDTGVTWIDVGDQNISDLTGIEYYTALKYLYCKNNQLTSLKIINNTKLEYFDCSSNQLASLNVTSNKSLKSFNCSGNQLTSLDVSHNTALKYLYCLYNQLTELDLSNNTQLIQLQCENNQLALLNVSNCALLSFLWCSENELTALDVSHNVLLKDFQCWDNKLTSLDLSNNRNLEKTLLGYQYPDSYYYTESNGVYYTNLLGLPNGNLIDLSRVTINGFGELDTLTGIVTFDWPPGTIGYTYNTGYPAGGGTTIRVSISVTKTEFITALHYIKVINSTTNLPVQYATVMLNGSSYTTNESGLVMVTHDNQTENSVTVTCDGYEIYSSSAIVLALGEITTIELEMQEEEITDTLLGTDPFADAATGSTTLTEPIISFLGKDFSLLPVTTEIQLDFIPETLIQVNVDEEEKKIKLTIGKRNNSDNMDWKEDYNTIKDLYNNFSGYSADLIDYTFSELDIQQSTQKLAFPVSAYTAGYIELSYANGECEFLEGGIIICVKTDNLASSLVYPFVPLPLIQVKYEFTIDATGTLSVVRDLNGHYGFNSTLEVDFKPAYMLNLGWGRFASVGGGLEGDLGVKFEFPWETMQESFEATLTGNLFLYVHFMGYNQKTEYPPFVDLQIYPVTTVNSAPVYSLDNFAQLDNYTVIERNSEPEEVLDSDAPLEAILETVQAQESELYTVNDDTADYPQDYLYARTNVYPDAAPTLVELSDGRLMLLWLGDDTTRNIVNKTALMYAIYDGTVWSQARQVYDDGTPDFNASVAVQGNKVFLVWQNTTRTFEESETLTDIIEEVDVFYSEFDGTSFSAPINLSNNTGTLNLMPTVVSSNNQLTAIWIENSENDPFSCDGTNTIVQATSNDGSSWSAATVIGNNLTAITGLAAAMVNDECILAYSTLGDDDISTIWVNAGSQPTRILQTCEFINCLQFSDQTLYWSSNDAVYSSDDFTHATELLTNAIQSDFLILTNNDQRAIAFLAADGFEQDIYIMLETDYGWENPVQLTDFAGEFNQISGYLTADNSVMLSYLFSTIPEDIEENGYGSTHMLISNFGYRSWIDVDEELVYLNSDVMAGETLPMYITIQNKGTKETPPLRITLYDEQGAVITTQDYNDAIGVGEEVEIEIDYTLAETLELHTVSAIVGTQDLSVMDYINDTAEAIIGYGNLTVTDQAVQRVDGGAKVTFTVRNDGYDTMEGNSVSVYVDGEDEIFTFVRQIDPLAPGETSTQSFTLLDANLVASDQYDYRRIVIETETSSTEILLSDNTAECLLAPVLPDSIILSDSSISLLTGETRTISYEYLPDNAADIPVVWTSDAIEIATVDQSGNISATGSGTTMIRAISEDGNTEATCIATVKYAPFAVGKPSYPGNVAGGSQITVTADVTGGNSENGCAYNWYLFRYMADYGYAVIPMMNVGVFEGSWTFNLPDIEGIYCIRVIATDGTNVGFADCDWFYVYPGPFTVGKPTSPGNVPEGTVFTTSTAVTGGNSASGCAYNYYLFHSTGTIAQQLIGVFDNSWELTLDIQPSDAQQGLGSIYLIRVIATDGTNVGYADTDWFYVYPSAGGTQNLPLTILTQPTDQMVGVGSPATFSVEATGNEPLTYQWYVNHNSGIGWMEIANNNNNTYTTNAVTLTDDGFRYYCKITDAAGASADSDAAILTVVVPPQTGDDTDPIETVALAMLAAAGVIALLWCRRRSKAEK